MIQLGFIPLFNSDPDPVPCRYQASSLNFDAFLEEAESSFPSHAFSMDFEWSKALRFLPTQRLSE
jgi:hypothetical protein